MDPFDQAWGDTSSTTSISDFDMAWDGGIPAEASDSSGFLSSILEGLREAPSTALNTITSIPSGVRNIFQSVFSPVESINSGKTEETLEGVGKLASGTAGGIAGASAGAAAGTPLAPFTFGLSIPVGAILGGAVGGAGGSRAFDSILEILGLEDPTPIEKQVSQAGKDIGTGIAFGTALKAVGEGAKAIAPTTKEISNALGRRSIGAKQSHYGKASDVRTIETPEGGVETVVKAKLDELLEKGELGPSRDPASMVQVANAKSLNLANKLTDVINRYDAAPDNPPALPTFDNTIKYIESGKVPATEVYARLQEVIDLENAIKAEGAGKLFYLQAQKKAIGERWNPADKARAGFDRALYNDLKTSIERYAPEVQSINEELSKFRVAEPILMGGLKAQEAATVATKMRDIGFTTGGIAAPGVLGTLAAGPAGGTIGLLAGGALRAAASPRGQSVLSKVFKLPVSKTAELLTAPAIAAGQIQNDPTQSGPKNPLIKEMFTPSSGTNMDNKQPDIAIVEQEIDKDPYYSALYEAESGRNPKAKNPQSTAKGGFQFIDSTAKGLGLDDPLDLSKSFEAVKSFTDRHRELFGNDPALLYSAHYLGETVLRKVLKGLPLSEKEESQVEYLKEKALPDFLKIYKKKASIEI